MPHRSPWATIQRHPHGTNTTSKDLTLVLRAIPRLFEWVLKSHAPSMPVRSRYQQVPAKQARAHKRRSPSQTARLVARSLRSLPTSTRKSTAYLSTMGPQDRDYARKRTSISKEPSILAPQIEGSQEVDQWQPSQRIHQRIKGQMCCAFATCCKTWWRHSNLSRLPRPQQCHHQKQIPATLDLRDTGCPMQCQSLHKVGHHCHL